MITNYIVAALTFKSAEVSFYCVKTFCEKSIKFCRKRQGAPWSFQPGKSSAGLNGAQIQEALNAVQQKEAWES